MFGSPKASIALMNYHDVSSRIQENNFWRTFVGADERLDEAYPLYLWREQRWYGISVVLRLIFDVYIFQGF